MESTISSLITNSSEYRLSEGSTPIQLRLRPENFTRFISSSSPQDVYINLPQKHKGFRRGELNHFAITLKTSHATNTATLSNGSPSSIIQGYTIEYNGIQLESSLGMDVYSALVEDFQPETSNINTIMSSGSTTKKVGQVLPTLNETGVRLTFPFYSKLIGKNATQNLSSECPLRLKLIMAPSNTALVSAGEVHYIIDDFELVDNLSILGDNEFASFMSQSKGLQRMHCVGTAHTTTAIRQAELNPQVSLPFNFGSIRNLLSVCLPATSNATTANSTGNRINPRINAYSYNSSGIVIPQLPIIGSRLNVPMSSNVMYEVLLAFGLVGHQTEIVFDRTDYEAVGAADQQNGAFVFGYSFESQNRGSVGGINGYSTIGENLTMSLQLNGASSAPGAAADAIRLIPAFNMHTFCHYDCIVEVDLVNKTMVVSQ